MSKGNSRDIINEIADLEDRINTLRRSYLESKGWHNTSSTPGSFWMWEKELKDFKVLVSEKDAWRIQFHLDTPVYSDMEKNG